MGPTASGKTEVAIDLAKNMDCELISVDSVQVYRGLDVGTAKPNFPHHLIDIRDPSDTYSAVEFAKDASNLCSEITCRGKIPVLVGGSMLYFRILLDGFSNIPAADPSIRSAIEVEASNKGWEQLHSDLSIVDPISASKIHPNHSRRISRALEVYRSTGKPLSSWHETGKRKSVLEDKFRVLSFGLAPVVRTLLHERIERRFGAMMKAGFLEEVTTLFEREDLNETIPAMQAVGYRQLWRFLQKDITLEQACLESVSATRQVAKRQLTWLRSRRNLNWIYINSDGTLNREGYLKEKTVNPKNPADLIQLFLA